MKFTFLKEILCRAGVVVPPAGIHYFNGVLNYLNVGRWFRDRGLTVPVRCADRPSLYAYLAAQVSEPATYLEFGVFQGVSMGIWSGLLKSPQTRLAGFDSFEGLPENWGHFTDKQVFDVKGRLPHFDDPRVQLVKGWFDQTLPAYLRDFKPNASLVLHLDADLYSSTIYVLREMKPFLRPGTILLFDEFFDREHELKAFTEFLAEFPLNLECAAATRALTQVAFRILPGSSESAISKTGVPAAS